MDAALGDLAKGNFESGLARLNQDPKWHDEGGDLDGPFELAFPGVEGWGEALLTASLLKRHAANLPHAIEVFANKQVRSILANDSSFNVNSDQSDHEARSPLAVLRHALRGTLLREHFVPLAVPGSRPHPKSTARGLVSLGQVSTRVENIFTRSPCRHRGSEAAGPAPRTAEEAQRYAVETRKEADQRWYV